MINFTKNTKYVRWGMVTIFSFFLIVLLIILVNKPNNENISATNSVESTTEDLTVKETSTQASFETESFEEETTTEVTTEEPTTEAPDPEDLINFDAEYPFEIEINRSENFAVIYGLDSNGQYSIAYKSFWCSTGLNPEDTPLGVFRVSDKYRWRLMVDGTYAQYAMRIHGQIMLHSVPYLEASCDTLEYWEYNKIGKPASLGCVRFKAGVIKWIYDNCEPGTTVVIYDNPGEEPPIELKKLKKLKKSDEKSCWDPTDPDKDNPWKKKGKDKFPK